MDGSIMNQAYNNKLVLQKNNWKSFRYAFDFPNEYHGVRCATDFVR